MQAALLATMLFSLLIPAQARPLKRVLQVPVYGGHVSKSLADIDIDALLDVVASRLRGIYVPNRMERWAAYPTTGDNDLILRVDVHGHAKCPLVHVALRGERDVDTTASSLARPLVNTPEQPWISESFTATVWRRETTELIPRDEIVAQLTRWADEFSVDFWKANPDHDSERASLIKQRAEGKKKLEPKP